MKTIALARLFCLFCLVCLVCLVVVSSGCLGVARQEVEPKEQERPLASIVDRVDLFDPAFLKKASLKELCLEYHKRSQGNKYGPEYIAKGMPPGHDAWRDSNYRDIDIAIWDKWPVASHKAMAQLALAMRSKGISAKEMNHVRKAQIFIGMTESALWAAWGETANKNRSVSKYGSRTQHVYGSYGLFSSPVYVYTENGVITSWQD